MRNGSINIFLVVFMLAVATQWDPALSQSNDNEYTAALKLLDQMAADEDNAQLTRDSGGALTELHISHKFKTDQSFRLISQIRSITNLVIAWSNVPETLTPTGIGYLGGMSNLANLRFVCHAKGLSPGILESVSRLSKLRELWLYYADAPAEDYAFLKNMTNLTSLKLDACRHFGNQELQVVTNLTSLTNFVLRYTQVTESGTNILRHLPSLTHVEFVPSATIPAKR